MLKKCFSNKKFVVGFIILVPLIIVMIFGNFLVPNDPYALDTVNMLKNSSAKYPLGTDEYGRCILTRLILGIRRSPGRDGHFICGRHSPGGGGRISGGKDRRRHHEGH